MVTPASYCHGYLNAAHVVIILSRNVWYHFCHSKHHHFTTAPPTITTEAPL